MRCLLYVRVSTEEQVRHGHSLGAQEEDCRRRALALGYADDRILLIREEGVSGEVVDRPGLNRLRDLIAAGGVGHVVMYDPDRFARNLSLQLIVTDEIVRAGAALEFVNFEWRDTPEGRLFYSLRGAIAEYEKAKIKERTRRGRERMVKEGKLPTDPRLYGYRWNPGAGRFEPHPEEFPVLMWIKEMALAGGNAHAICRSLAAAGVPAPRGVRWHPSTVWKLLHNPDYTGAYQTGKRGGVRRTFPLEAAWDEVTHRRLAAVGRSSRPASGALLSGLLYCGVCGGTVHMGIRTAAGYRYYACNRKARVAYGPGGERQTGCSARYWPAQLLEEAVWGAVAPLLERRLAQPLPQREPGEAEVLRRVMAGSYRREERLLRLYLDGRIDEAAYDRERVSIIRKREEAERVLTTVSSAQRPPTPALRTTPSQALLRAALTRVLVGPGERLAIFTPLAGSD